MTDHDPMCPQYDQTEHTIAMFDTPCRCEEYARVRADERAKADMGLLGNNIDLRKALAHAEAVAAKLVEVICEQDDLIQIVGVDATNHRAAAADMRRERDAARAVSAAAQAEARIAESEVRVLAAEVAALKKDMQDGNEAIAQVMEELRQKSAEVAALREQYVVEEFIDTDGYPSMRVVKGEHVGQNEWAANIRREVLADLREQVLMLEHDATCSFIPQDGPCDCVRGAVLALIEEAQP